MHRIGRGFFFPLSSSWITEEVAALVCWLYNGTVLRFVVVVFFFQAVHRNLVLIVLFNGETSIIPSMSSLVL